MEIANGEFSGDGYIKTIDRKDDDLIVVRDTVFNGGGVEIKCRDGQTVIVRGNKYFKAGFADNKGGKVLGHVILLNGLNPDDPMVFKPCRINLIIEDNKIEVGKFCEDVISLNGIQWKEPKAWMRVVKNKITGTDGQRINNNTQASVGITVDRWCDGVLIDDNEVLAEIDGAGIVNAGGHNVKIIRNKVKGTGIHSGINSWDFYGDGARKGIEIPMNGKFANVVEWYIPDPNHKGKGRPKMVRADLWTSNKKGTRPEDMR